MRKGNDRTIRLVLLVLVLALAAPLLFGDESRAAQKQLTITGVVKRAEITPKGEVRRVYIESAAGEEYLVVRRGKGKELLTQTRETIEATGYISKSRMDQDFEFVIEVMEFAVLEETPSAVLEAPAEAISGP
jgi:hypothetical protein